MTESIKHAESKILFYKLSMATCDESMTNYYYKKAVAWMNHLADLKKEHEQQMIKQ